MIIDFHCHLDLYANYQEIANTCLDKNVYLLSVTNTPKAFRITSQIPKAGSKIRTALGLHPQLAHERKQEIALFDELVIETKYVGEIGLDGSPGFAKHHSDQLYVFKNILDILSRNNGRIMSIHSKGAVDIVLEALSVYSNSGIPILHWFTGTKYSLAAAVKQGCYFSVGPKMLASKAGNEICRNIPRTKILPETDGPFTKMNGVVLKPWDAYKVYPILSAMWGVPVNEVQVQISDNLRTLLKLL